MNDLIIIHPLLIINILSQIIDNKPFDLYNKNKIGIIMGKKKLTMYSCINGFNIPSEKIYSSSWFLDYNFVEKMILMLSRINSKEKIIGWYLFSINNHKIDSNLVNSVNKLIKSSIYVLFCLNVDKKKLYIKGFNSHVNESNILGLNNKIKCVIGLTESENIVLRNYHKNFSQVNTKYQTIGVLKSSIKQINNKFRDISMNNGSDKVKIRKIFKILKKFLLIKFFSRNSFRLINSILILLSKINKCLGHMESVIKSYFK
ncbi:26S proteasome regulatory SU [Guillardia theta]|uniref:26S proteasome regulatory SU n=1 Tax=Guillardia theta TaxID=55529 RepID=Q9AW26_GUITH|nr:26S proteasome regulatory SU [Guillardia theta]CAC27045.1 26S proteasome regulatory SU [Guillardia theta]|mmetsp:Transcript_24133/g.78570  ORF Transcript_24133/g.78570 Transcript_24133/m.78570 type:complete len:259 (+) Transcript_24133:3052-3828(+)